ncbi:hypothetical protein ASJ79_26495 [Mycobacterium sp. NAZ190054]|nr:hypothetical protein ASJ79_26495 [Mycobacterium sp. NAZ190054]
MDGTGTVPITADVLIDGDRIRAVVAPGGPAVDAAADRVVDVSGRLVTPGFIDLHAHDDLAVGVRPDMSFKVSQGITTVVVGNCGNSASPLAPTDAGAAERLQVAMGPAPDPISWTSMAGYLDWVESCAPAVNVAALVGHGGVRLAAGVEWGRASAAERTAMCRIVADAVAEGAVGMSSGLIYHPGREADEQEVAQLARAAVQAGGLYSSHIRDEGDAVQDAVAEALRIGDAAGRPAHISHLKAMGPANWGLVPGLIDSIARAGASFDVYPYRAASTYLTDAVEVLGGAHVAPPADLVIAAAPGREDLVGRDFSELTAEWSCDLAEAVHRVDAETSGRCVVVYFGMDEPDVIAAVTSPHGAYGTDGLPILTGRPHPRLFGTFTRVLRHYVLDTGALSVQAAVHKASGLPAALFGLPDRGVIRAGAVADILVIDPATIADRATYADPMQYSAGLDAVFVSGEPTWTAAGPTGIRAGRVLRHGR